MENTLLIKKCSQCGVEKTLSCFHKQKATKDGYRTICKECRKGEDIERYLLNKKEIVARTTKWQKDNPERAKEIQAKSRLKNKEKRKDYIAKWRSNNRGKINALNSTRNAAKKKRTPQWLTSFDILKIQCLYSLAAMRSKESGQKWHVDHIVPLQGNSVCGLHVPWNLRVIPAIENLRKYNKYD